MKELPPPTTQERHIMLYVIHHKQINGGRPPTRRQIKTAVGASSTSVVAYRINKLIEKGYLDDRTLKIPGETWKPSKDVLQALVIDGAYDYPPTVFGPMADEEELGDNGLADD